MAMNKLKDRIGQLLEESTSHGLPNIIRSKFISMKIMWLVCFLGASAICGFLLFLSIVKYLQFGVNTQLAIIYEIPTEFPAVTFCNENAFVSNSSTSYFRDVFSANGLKDPIDFQLDSVGLNSIMGSYYANINAFQVSAEKRRMLSTSIDDILISCSFNLQPCTTADFEYSYNTLHGNCYTFNSGRNDTTNIPKRQTSKPGKLNGLIIELNLGNRDNLEAYYWTSGAHIFVHNGSILPDSYEGITISTGIQTNIVVDRVYTKKLAHPFSNCLPDDMLSSFSSPYIDPLMNRRYKYRQSDCFNLCFQAKLVEKCHCYESSNLPADLNFTQLYPNTTHCSTIQDVFCVYTFFFQYFTKFKQEDCSEYCPEECDTICYDLSLSFSDYPTYQYSRYLVNRTSKLTKYKADDDTVTYENLKKSILSFSVYYDKMKYTQISETAVMDTIDMLSALGGNMGLLLGMSVLTFVELIQIVIEGLCILWTTKKRVKSSTVVEQAANNIEKR